MKQNSSTIETKTLRVQKINGTIFQRVKGLISMIILIFFIHLSCVPALYIIYTKILLEKNLYVLVFFVIQQIYQHKYCKRWDWLLNSELVKTALYYFDSWSLTLEEKIPDEKALICFHPHGVICFGMTMFSSLKGPIKIKNAFASRVILTMPLSGMFLKWISVEGINPKNLQAHLDKSNSIAIVPGGFEEATITSYQKSRVFIQTRKGFIKYALQYGYKVFPSYVFGENKCFYTFEPFMKLRLALNKYKVPGIGFISKWGVLPNRETGLHCVVGESMKLPKIDKPSKEQVEKYHQEYVQNLKSLYYRYRDQFGETSELEVY